MREDWKGESGRERKREFGKAPICMCIAHRSYFPQTGLDQQILSVLCDRKRLSGPFPDGFCWANPPRWDPLGYFFQSKIKDYEQHVRSELPPTQAHFSKKGNIRRSKSTDIIFITNTCRLEFLF